MKLFDSIKDTLILSRKEDEALHAQVLHEIESGFRRDGLWSKALVNAGGSEERAKAEYIKLVVRDLRDQRYIESRVHDLAKETNQSEIDDQILGSLIPTQQQTEYKYPDHYSAPIGTLGNVDRQAYEAFFRDGDDVRKARYRDSEKARKIELIALIETIKSGAPLSLKAKAKVIEMAGGLVRWNDPLDPSKGGKITLDGIERDFENMDSMEKWIDHIAVRRIQDYLLAWRIPE